MAANSPGLDDPGRPRVRVIVPLDYKGRQVSRLMRAVAPPPGVSVG